MTEQGGNIVMWSSNGTSMPARAPRPRCPSRRRNSTATSLDLQRRPQGVVSGAGIATLQSLPGVPLGNADLIAPRGTVDAGAAGIRVSGNLNIAALQVLNAFNIQVQGVTTGVPGAVRQYRRSDARSNAAGAGNKTVLDGTER